ncbi:MAG: chemotaxis protein CheD [Sterolibacterium sp.]|jgi:chemotaxis protein CheD
MTSHDANSLPFPTGIPPGDFLRGVSCGHKGGGPASPIFLNAGDFYFGAAPLQLTTLLGSCVTVTFWQPRRQIGGMCHFLVPRRPGGAKRPETALDGQYAEEAFLLFDRAVADNGCGPEQFQAKLFGGGNMFPGRTSGIDVGAQNIAAARLLLRRRGIPLLAEHAGGAGHRKLIFDLATGEVQMHFVDITKERDHG